jgi:hypothetical protein
MHVINGKWWKISNGLWPGKLNLASNSTNIYISFVGNVFKNISIIDF